MILALELGKFRTVACLEARPRKHRTLDDTNECVLTNELRGGITNGIHAWMTETAGHCGHFE